jgi:hypothetical protein
MNIQMKFRNTALFCLAGIVISRLVAAYVFSTFDDAYITYRYALHIAHGSGLIYNTGEKVLGTTAPLFAFIAAIPAFLSLSMPRFIVAFNIFCDVASAYLIFVYGFQRRLQLLILFAVLLAIDAGVVRISVGGMEADLFFLGSLLGVVWYLKDKRLLSFTLLSLLYFLRPEAVVLFLLLVIYDTVRNRKIPWKILALPVLMMTLLLLCIFKFYGQVLPQSVVVRNLGSANSIHELIGRMFFPYFLNYFIFPLAIYGIIKYARKNPFLVLMSLWLIFYSLAYIIRGPWIMNWYVYAISVLQLIFATLALDDLITLWNVKRTRFKITIPRWLPVVAIVPWLVFLWISGRSGVERNVYQPLATDFDDGRAVSKSFFADDIGALGYYTGGYIFDNLMLVTPQAALWPDAKTRILQVKPDYLFLYCSRYYLTLVEDPEIRSRYRFVKRYSRFGELTYPSWSTAVSDYKQDYMLFVKIR